MAKEKLISISTFDSLCPLIKAGWTSHQKGGEGNRVHLTYGTPDPLTLGIQRQSQANTALNTVCRRCIYKGNDNSQTGLETVKSGKCYPSREFEDTPYPEIGATIA